MPSNHLNQFEFVIVPSMINNGGHEIKVFTDCLSCVIPGGFIIFATKLNY